MGMREGEAKRERGSNSLLFELATRAARCKRRTPSVQRQAALRKGQKRADAPDARCNLREDTTGRNAAADDG